MIRRTSYREYYFIYYPVESARADIAIGYATIIKNEPDMIYIYISAFMCSQASLETCIYKIYKIILPI